MDITLILTIINIILWVAIGVMNFTSKKIDKVSYACAWIMIMLLLFENLIGI